MRFSTQLVWISVLISLSACGKPDEVLDVGIFAPYVQKFEAQSIQYGRPLTVTNLIIHYGQMRTETERGACEINGDNTPAITLRQDTWEVMPEAEREELLFHEMGHCVLHRPHQPALNDYGLPVSIMNPYIIQGSVYQGNRNAYLTELFSAP